MRVSIVKGDPGYDPTHTRRVQRVTVDGLPVVSVTADEEQGFVDELVIDSATGRAVLDPVDGSPLTRRVTGRVRIELRKASDREWDASRRGEAKVQVGREPGTGDILVQVYSHVRPGAIKQGRIARLAQTGRMETMQLAGVTAGAIAEMLCDQFGDRIDPDECARVALDQCMKLLMDEAQDGKAG